MARRYTRYQYLVRRAIIAGVPTRAIGPAIKKLAEERGLDLDEKRTWEQWHGKPTAM